MQGKVTDGQYLCEGFIDSMNQPLFDEIPLALQEEFWWPLQWDPGYWLDKVFSKFYDDNQFVSRLLLRTNLFHTMFNCGKMHAVAKETAKELKLPFKTTVLFAKQIFMSSSYKQFLKLETTIEAYINVFRDHDNEEVKEYKLAGQDFVLNHLGVIDLLWPLVLTMLCGQMLSCPGWTIATWITQVKDQMNLFATQVSREIPSLSASPRLHKHATDIAEYKSVELVQGWLIESEEPGKQTNWSMRKLMDCRDDLKQLASQMVLALAERSESGIPDLLYILQKCLDFGVLFSGLCGERMSDGAIPVKRYLLMQVGQGEFRR